MLFSWLHFYTLSKTLIACRDMQFRCFNAETFLNNIFNINENVDYVVHGQSKARLCIKLKMTKVLQWEPARRGLPRMTTLVCVVSASEKMSFHVRLDLRWIISLHDLQWKQHQRGFCYRYKFANTSFWWPWIIPTPNNSLILLRNEVLKYYSFFEILTIEKHQS